MMCQHVTDGSRLPISHCSGRFLSCCQGSDRGMVLVDRSEAYAEIGSRRIGAPGRNSHRGPVAQRIEQQPSKLKVAGSIPAGVAMRKSFTSLFNAMPPV